MRMGNRRRPRGLPRSSTSVMDFAIAQIFRSQCSQCGSGMLQWFTGAEAAALMGARESAEMLALLPRSERAGAACWRCLSCGGAGAFGDSTVG
jgi:hypothetical protein